MNGTSLPFTIPVRRGCGIRIEGGLYIVTTAEIKELADYTDLSDANIEGKLILFPQLYPTLVPLKPFRGFRGFDKRRFFRELNLEIAIRDLSKSTPIARKQIEKMFGKSLPEKGTGRLRQRPRLHNCYYAHPEDSHSWLHWMGNIYYSIESFIEEARSIGVSRRVPKKTLKKMKWGDTIFLASKEKGLKAPVIFGYFSLHMIQGIKVDMDSLPEHLQKKMHYKRRKF